MKVNPRAGTRTEKAVARVAKLLADSRAMIVDHPTFPDGSSVPRPGFGPYPKLRRRPNTGRDLWISIAMKWLIDEGYPPTRNWTKRGNEEDQSACSIIAMVLNRAGLPITEAAVKKIWDKGRVHIKD